MKKKYYFLMLIFIVIILFSIIYYFKSDKLNKNFYYIPEIDSKLYILEDNYKTIKKELEELQLRWLKWPETNLYQGDNWSVIPIYAFNKWIPKYKKNFPLTINIVSKIPNVQTLLFSRVKPHTIIDPHQGWAMLSNRILRCHLTISVSNKGANYIAVENQKRNHQLGKLIIFDDSKIHYSVNKSHEERIVLIIDIKRPIFVEEGKSKIQETPELLDLLKRI